MKIKLLTVEIKNQIKDELNRLFNGETDIIDIDVCCPSTIVNILDDFLGLDVHDDIDVNGWDWDFWKNFSYNDKTYCLSGSGYYGRTSIEEIEEYED